MNSARVAGGTPWKIAEMAGLGRSPYPAAQNAYGSVAGLTLKASLAASVEAGVRPRVLAEVAVTATLDTRN